MGGGARGPMPHPPSEPARRGKSLWAEEALSKQRNAAWSPRDGGGEEGGGGAAEAAWLPASPPASPRELPPPPTGATAAPGKRGGGCARPLFSSSLLQIRDGKESARLRCSARSPSPVSALSRWLGWGPSRPKCPKTRGALRTCPAAERRASREGRGRPALALLQPSGQGNRPVRRRGAGELEPSLVSRRGRAAETPLQAWSAPTRSGAYTRAVGLANTPL